MPELLFKTTPPARKETDTMATKQGGLLVTLGKRILGFNASS